MVERNPNLRRLLTRLKEGAVLRRTGGVFVLAGRRGPKSVIASETVAALITEGLVEDRGDGIALTREGLRWLSGSPRELETRLTRDADGREHYVVVNAAESPLGLLAHRGLIGAVAFEAGEKLRRDYTIGQLTARMGVDYAAPVGGHAFRPDLTETVVAARQRFNRALCAAGPGLADVLFDVCCYLFSLEDCEKARGWPRGSARVVLGLALERLAAHYGMTAPGAARTRVWTAED